MSKYIRSVLDDILVYFTCLQCEMFLKQSVDVLDDFNHV